MSKISDGSYPAASSVVPTARGYIYDPTDGTNPDKTLSETLMASIPSVVKGFADNAVITVGAEVADVRAITVQLQDANGTNLTKTSTVRLTVYTSAAATALSTGGSTGLAIGANGMILATIVAKKVFTVKSDATGKITLTWTDTGTDAAFLGVGLPDGREVIGGAMTNT